MSDPPQPEIEPIIPAWGGEAIVLAEALVREFEGCVLHPYPDRGGTWTIGIGTIRIDGHAVTADTQPIPQARADALMMAELAPTCAAVRAMAPVGATEAQIGACTDFAYNLGLGALRGSTLFHRWSAGDAAGAALHFADWRFVHDPVTHQLIEEPGLVRRREAERTLFLSG